MMNAKIRGYYVVEDDREGRGWIELHGHMRLGEDIEDGLKWELVEYGRIERFPLNDDLSWLEDELEYRDPEPEDLVNYLSDEEAEEYHQDFLGTNDGSAHTEAYLPPSALCRASPCGNYYFGKE